MFLVWLSLFIIRLKWAERAALDRSMPKPISYTLADSMGPAHLRSLRRPIKYAPNHILLRKIKNNVAHPVKIMSIFLYLESD